MKSKLFSRLSGPEKALFGSSFFNGFGLEIAYFVGISGYAAYDLNASASLIATVMVALNIANVLGNLVCGIIVDRLGARRAVMTSLSIFIFISLGGWFVGKSIPLFIAFASLVGFFIAFSKTAYSSYAPYLEEGKSGLKRINSLVLFSAYVAGIVGPMVGGTIVKYYPTMTLFLACAVVNAIALVLILFAREQYTPHRPEERHHPLREATEGIRLVFSETSLRYYLVLGIMMFFSFGAFDALESLYYKDVVGASIEWMGWINGMIGVGMVVGVLTLSRIPGRLLNSVWLAVLVAGVGAGSIVYVATRSVAVVMLGGFLLGLAFGMAEPLMRTLVQADAPLSKVGRVLGAIGAFRVFFTVIPLAVSPALSRVFGVQNVLIGASVLTVVLGVALIPLGRRVDRKLAAQRVIYHVDPLGGGRGQRAS